MKVAESIVDDAENVGFFEITGYISTPAARKGRAIVGVTSPVPPGTCSVTPVSGVIAFAFGLDAFGHDRHAEERGREHQKGHRGHARYHGKEQQYGRNQLQRLGMVGHLADEFFAHARFGRSPADDDALFSAVS